MCFFYLYFVMLVIKILRSSFFLFERLRIFIRKIFLVNSIFNYFDKDIFILICKLVRIDNLYGDLI